MGTLVVASNDSDTKPNYAVSSELAGVFVFLDGGFSVWVGSSVPINLPATVGLTQCLQALREVGWPNPEKSLDFNSAKYSSIDGTLTVTLGTVTPILLETDVVIVQGFDFTQSADSNTGHAKRMIESFLESAKAA